MKLTSGQIKNSSLVAGSTITDALNTLRTSSGSGTGDMVKTVYDTDNDGKVDVANLADSVPWTGVTDKPVTFTPALHNHPVSEVTGLQSALDGKASSTHTHAISDVTGLQTALDGKASSTHAHAISDVTGLQTALDSKQDVLVSGVNIKTINSESLLGSGNIIITGGGGGATATDIHAATSKTTPADADELGITDSAASWGLKKLTFANLKAVLLAYFKGQFREKLTAARTYYVRTDGSDSNNGLTNTSGGAFLTIQKAVDAFASLDLNGKSATIQVGDGTWTASVLVTQAINGTLVITGNATTPDNVLISLTGGSCISAVGSTTNVHVQHAKLQTTGISALVARNGATITGTNLTFGACGYAHVAANTRGQVLVQGACRIVGSAPAFANLDNGFLDATQASFTLTGTPNFTAFVYAYAISYARIVLATISGTATGKRYQVESNSYISVAGAGANYLPGDAAGTTATGGQYS